MKKLLLTSLLVMGILAAAALPSAAQPAPPLPTLVGTPIQINGQTYLLTANSNGVITATSTGPYGSTTITVPTSVAAGGSQIANLVGQNNTNDASFYATNEIEIRFGGAYQQNNGESVATAEVVKWGLTKYPIGIEAGIAQSNNNGKNGTAGEWVGVEYRKVIGSVAFVGGAAFLRDNENSTFGGVFSAGAELRYNKNLGIYSALTYTAEAKGEFDRGAGVRAGVTCSF